MKRLLILTLLLLPSTIRELDSMAHASSGMAIDPAAGLTASVANVQVESDLMATPERADADAILKLKRELSDRLSLAGIPRDWEPPARLTDTLVVDRVIREVPKDYAVMHRETLHVDLSPAVLSRFKSTYENEVAGRRLVTLGEILLFVLALLAAIAGYIHADEATKGYYTNHLRLATAAGIGAASVVAYRLLV